MALTLSAPRPKLLVRMIEAGDAVKPLLADADGVPLPMQRSVSIAYNHEGLAEVTVTFAIDGEHICQVPDRMSQ